MKPTFNRRATLADAYSIAPRLRKADRDEVLAAIGIDPILALPAAVQEGRDVWVAGLEEDGIPEIIWGIDPIEHPDDFTAGTIWLLSTDRIYEFPVEFVQNTRRLLDEAHKEYELLMNFIDARNTRHQKWLKWMGFAGLRRIEKFGAQSLPFIEFASFRPCA